MSKDSDDCDVMNELFDSGVHWHPVSIYNKDDTKIRDLTKQEQIEWIKKQKESASNNIIKMIKEKQNE